MTAHGGEPEVWDNGQCLFDCLQKEVPLGNPDVLVCSVGTEIFFEATGASPEADEEWKKELDQGWNRQAAIDAAASFSELKPQV
jgi:hypothetical protein